MLIRFDRISFKVRKLFVKVKQTPDLGFMIISRTTCKSHPNSVTLNKVKGLIFYNININRRFFTEFRMTYMGIQDFCKRLSQ